MAAAKRYIRAAVKLAQRGQFSKKEGERGGVLLPGRVRVCAAAAAVPAAEHALPWARHCEMLSTLTNISVLVVHTGCVECTRPTHVN